ncbi:hypothetical protein GAY33_34415 [Azospirillum brasilense]|uniref:hypothetical protein n=1 Tax=Azospirillum argentinense TaxID=2970906 RepID=UPI00190EB074|nr:hypothetical protein [Azospirillum argentinense]MBK3804167.1 hypothetical protein [Azospirillum argentinense]
MDQDVNRDLGITATLTAHQAVRRDLVHLVYDRVRGPIPARVEAVTAAAAELEMYILHGTPSVLLRFAADAVGATLAGDRHSLDVAPDRPPAPVPDPVPEAVVGADSARTDLDDHLFALLQSAIQEERACPSNLELGQALGVHWGQVPKALRRLEGEGRITVQYLGSNRRQIIIAGCGTPWSTVATPRRAVTAQPDAPETALVEGSLPMPPVDEPAGAEAGPGSVAAQTTAETEGGAEDLDDAVLRVVAAAVADRRESPTAEAIAAVLSTTSSEVADAMERLVADGVLQREAALRGTRLGVGGDWTRWPCNSRADYGERLYAHLKRAVDEGGPCPSNGRLQKALGLEIGQVGQGLSWLQEAGHIAIERESNRRRVCIDGRWSEWTLRRVTGRAAPAATPATTPAAPLSDEPAVQASPPPAGAVDQAMKLLRTRDYVVTALHGGRYLIDGRKTVGASDLVAMANRNLIAMGKPTIPTGAPL